MLKKSFNENWSFSKDSGLMFAAASEQTEITLPHDAMIVEPRNVQNVTRNAGGFFPGGNYEYTKQFYVPDEYMGKKVILEFEGVYNKAKVFVNGDFICGNLYGYTEFYADITGHLHYGKENLIQVKVTNGDVPNSRWYTGSGIYRPVNMLVGNEVYVKPNGLRIITLEAAEDVSTVEAAVRLKYSGTLTKTIYVYTEIREKGKTDVVVKETTPVTLYADDELIVRQRVYIRDAKLWSTDHPNLYTCHTQILEMEDDTDAKNAKQHLLDEAEETFGIRHIQADPVYGFRINGEQIKLRGSCIHHDNGVIGAATFAYAEERRVRLSRDAGFNALRISHNTASRALLDACDRLGVLVMDESFDMWNHGKSSFDYSQLFDKHWEEEVEAIVAKDYNHPCVIMYSIGNEIQEVGTGAGARLNRQIAEKFRALDATRYVTNAINGFMTVMDKMGVILKDLKLVSDQEERAEGGDINDLMTAVMGNTEPIVTHPLVGKRMEESCSGLDLCGYNYMTARYKMDPKEYPNRLIFGSETYAPQIAENWKYVKEEPSVLGDFTWTGYDYLGEAGIGVPGYNGPGGFATPFPCYMANVGDIDLVGYRRPMSYYREIVWGLRKEPYLAVQLPEHYADDCSVTPWITEAAEASWTWPGYEEKPCKVEVYSGDEEVELFINGESCGKKTAGEDQGYKAIFDTIYKPGKVTAVAYRDGKETGRYEIVTAEDNLHLSIQPDRKELRAGGENLAFLMISIRDKNEVLNMSVGKKVSIQVTGAGTLQGFGSADPCSTENFFDTERTTYRGMVLAVVRAGAEEGEIFINVEAEGCEPASLKLVVR